MDWGKVIYIFFSLMSFTTIAGFIYDHNPINLYIAVSLNLISTVLKVGVRNLLAAELLASSLVADLHLLPAFFVLQFANNIDTAIALSIGALIANAVSVALVLIESAKTKEEF